MNYKKLMKRAISLADQYKYTAKPNHVVGCIIVKGETIISEGAHKEFGSNHAEVNAIEEAKKNQGITFDSFGELTLICSLEPCNHTGKTGPCSEAIISSGIRNVVVGAEDPNPLVSGSGIRNLINHGVKVQSGVCAELVEEQNKFFFFKNKNNRPYITVKIASSRDGKSYLPNEERTYITCKESIDDVQKVRANYDAILTGGNTVINDSPRMNARVSFPVNQPKKILLSNKSNFDLDADFFVNCEYEILNETNIDKIIERYRYKDITSILVEAGPKLVNAFLDSGKVDEIIIYQSPNNLGINGVNWFKEDNSVEKLSFKLESSYKIKADTKKIYIKC